MHGETDEELADRGMERRPFGGGSLIMHSQERCSGFCAIHAPSDHHMVEWLLHWRNDRSLFERICPHGVGHPDPDHLTYVEQEHGFQAAETESVHGCHVDETGRACCAPR